MSNKPICSHCANCTAGERINETIDRFKCNLTGLWIDPPKKCDKYINETKGETTDLSMERILEDLPAIAGNVITLAELTSRYGAENVAKELQSARVRLESNKINNEILEVLK